MKAIIISTKSQYTLTRTSSGHLAMFITVLIKETSGSHEEPSSTAVWQTQACQLNKKRSSLQWLKRPTKHRGTSGRKEHRKIQVSRMWTNGKQNSLKMHTQASVLTEGQQQEVEMLNILYFKSLIFPKKCEWWRMKTFFFFYLCVDTLCVRAYHPIIVITLIAPCQKHNVGSFHSQISLL